MHRLRRDDPEVAFRQLARVGGPPQATDDVAGTAQAEPLAVDRVDVVLREVVGPDLDVVELGQVRGEERPDRAATHHTNPHEYDASLALTSRYTAVCSGASTPVRAASRTSAPLISSTSVGRRASTSSSIDGE